MSSESTCVIVQVYEYQAPLEQFNLDEALDFIPEGYRSWEVGGILDPVGQLINWLWSQIQGAFTVLGSTIWGFMQTIRDQIVSTLRPVIDNVSTALSGALANLLATLTDVSKNLLGKISDIGSFLSNVGNVLSGVASNLASGFLNLISLIQGSFSGLLTFLGQVRDALVSQILKVADTVVGALRPIIEPIASLMVNIGSTLSSLASQFVSSISNLAGMLQSIGSGILSSLASTAKNIITSISTGLENFGKTLIAGIQGAIGTIAQGITSIGSQIITFFQNLPTLLQQLGSGIASVIQQSFTRVTEALAPLSDILKNVGLSLASLGASIATGFDNVRNALIDMGGAVVKGFEDFKTWLESLTRRTEELSQRTAEVSTGVGEVKVTLMGYHNAMLMMPKWYREELAPALGMSIAKPLSEPLGKVGEVHGFAGLIYRDPRTQISGLWTAIWGTLKGAFTWIVSETSKLLLEGINALVGGFKLIGESIFTLVAQAQTGLWNVFGKLAEDVKKWLTETLKPYITGAVMPWMSLIEAEFVKIVGARGQRGYLEKLVEGWRKDYGEGEVLTTLIFGGFIGGQMLISAITWSLKSVARAIMTQHVSFTGSMQPAGVGAVVHFLWECGLGLALHDFADNIDKWFHEFYRGLVYGFSIWFSRPITRVLTYRLRNAIPVELPDLRTIEEYVRRTLPTNEFPNTLEYLHYFMALYGYSDEVISWFTKPVEQLNVTIKDRFNRERKIPLSLIYELPSASDVATMMVRDLFASVTDFENLVLSRGYSKDLAYMYYLTRWRYPPVDKLWLFYSRARAKMLWYKPPDEAVAYAKEEAEAVGAYMPVAPIELNEKPEIALTMLDTFMKWHDLAPFAWGEGWTSDKWLMIDLMADIPTRIDSRWMYKWRIIDDTMLQRIVTATGVHPDWIKPVTVAEAMNALAEERTLARGGVLSAYKEGFLDIGAMTTLFKELTRVKILGEEVSVGFLESEAKLLTIRANYDRAIDILRDWSRDMIRMATENLMDVNEVMNLLSQMSGAISKNMGIALGFDTSYWDLYKPVIAVAWERRTYDRIRIWIRYMMFRILTRFSEGYMSRAELDATIAELCKFGRLTETERKFLTDLSYTMYELFSRQHKTRGILKKLSRGLIKPEDAVQALKNLGLDPDTIDGLIEENVKTYTISIATLLSYADLISIPEDLLVKKMSLLGVPEDEAGIILEVFKIRPLRDEIARLVRQELDMYSDGYITDDEFREALKKLMKKPQEIDILLQAGKLYKQVKIIKMTIDRTLDELERGRITPEEALERLKKFIKDEDLARSLVESKRRIYTFTVDKLISMSEYVPVDVKAVVDKAVKLGYDPGEAKLLPAYKIARDLSEEIGRVVTELITDYANGLISRDTLSKMIDDVRTMGGKVKELGVDWIVIDDTEKEYLMYLAELRRARTMAKKA
jgi:phage-related protein